MTTQIEPDLHRNANVLVAAVQLRETHGLLYAMRFLEDYDFADVVIWEVFKLIPSDAAKKIDTRKVGTKLRCSNDESRSAPTAKSGSHSSTYR